jgi:predicted phage terminase large subunit-like protein
LSSGPERIPAVPYLTPKGKEERVHEIASFVEAGRVSIPRWAEWLDEYLGEITSFPLGAHDDYVDSTSQALQRIFGKEMGDGRAESIDYRQMHEVARLQQRRFER